MKSIFHIINQNSYIFLKKRFLYNCIVNKVFKNILNLTKIISFGRLFRYIFLLYPYQIPWRLFWPID